LEAGGILDGDPPKVAAVARVVVRACAVQRAAVVPHDEVAHLPAVSMDEPRLGRKGGQFLEKLAALLERPADDVRGMRGEVERLAAGARMHAHQGLRNRRQRSALLLRKISIADEATRMED
jgi:hypothetical protein